MDAGALSALQQRKKRLAGMGRGRKTFVARTARRRQKKGFAGLFPALLSRNRKIYRNKLLA